MPFLCPGHFRVSTLPFLSSLLLISAPIHTNNIAGNDYFSDKKEVEEMKKVAGERKKVPFLRVRGQKNVICTIHSSFFETTNRLRKIEIVATLEILI